MSDEATPHAQTDGDARRTGRRPASRREWRRRRFAPAAGDAPVGRNLGLVIALALICIVGVATAGDGSPASTTADDPAAGVGDRRGQRSA